jgi:hypothetical protein
MAFNASTGSVSYLKLSGLKLMNKILETYSSIPDPEFEGHSLLEQYEAQIISAMAPGFEIDASPEITDASCKVCGYFLASNILPEITTSSRPIRMEEHPMHM